MDSAIDQLNALHYQLFGQKNNNTDTYNKENYENGYNSDTDNEEEWPEIYITSNPKFDHQNADQAKKTKQFNGIKWKALVLALGNLIQQFIDERIEKWKSAQPADYLEKMEAKTVPTDALRAVSSNLQSTLGQFWKFVSTYEPGHALSIFDVVSRTRLRAFQRFLRSRFPSFGTIHKKLNDLRTLLKWMFKKSRFTLHHTHIRKCIDHISDNLVSLTRSMQHQQARQSDEKQLKQRGKLLNEKEFATLNDKCLETINRLMNIFTYRELDVTDNKRKKFGSLRNYAFMFQSCLQILCLIRMGTQRRQVISGMAGFEIEKPKERNSTDNSSNDDGEEDNEEQDPTEWMAKLYPTREKTVRKGCRAIPIPDEIYNLLEYFRKTVRDHLKPKPEVESLWISFKNGTVQQGYQMSIAIKNQIAEFLPGKHITPLDLRRSMPTIIQKLKFAGNEANTEALLSRFAKLINTSERMLQQHYIRYQDLNAQADLITTLNNNLTNTENTNRLLETTNQLMDINNRIESLRPTRSDPTDVGIALKDGNGAEADMEIIEPIPVPLFGLDLLGLTKRAQNRQDSNGDNPLMGTYFSALHEIQL